MENALQVKDLCAWFGEHQVLKNITMDIRRNSVTSVMGPSGCGKSTFIRCLNRMHDLTPGFRVAGDVLFDGRNIYSEKIDPVLLRRKVGMVFQQPNPFPRMSAFENVAVGLKFNGKKRTRSEMAEVVEKSLRMAALWDELKDHLDRPGTSLSGGQQQRLCIARALAVEPEVLLMDEPCSALDPVSAAKIEELIEDLSDKYTIVVVTHNMQQAGRISDFVAFFLLGDLIEMDKAAKIFTNPADRRTEEYITGRFG
ncbi:MAG: Phosphate import ATP-binding protein PstB [Actinobacteria bacterium]|jgi:phosphate transport system ATP-binding protein|nr:Phosphate import ATP-binding protein PstB [Actinomycetota bacterium]MBM2828408.1 Phosphate import ATP-binding protein PstB [Actinomycetota bacterium]